MTVQAAAHPPPKKGPNFSRFLGFLGQNGMI